MILPPCTFCDAPSVGTDGDAYFCARCAGFIAKTYVVLVALGLAALAIYFLRLWWGGRG